MPNCSSTTTPTVRGTVVGAVALGVLTLWPGSLRAQARAHDTAADRPAPESTVTAEAASDDSEPASAEETDASDNSETDRTSDDSETDDAYFDHAHRRQIYRDGRRHVSKAALRTALFPGLGNFYADQYFIGGINASLMAFTAILVPYGLVTDQPDFVWAGIGVAGAAYVSGFVTSAIGVQRYNRRLRRRLRLDETETSGAIDRRPSPWAIPTAPTITIAIPF